MKILDLGREVVQRITSPHPSRDQVEAVLREHVLVGGTFWDTDRKTTFYTCQCGTHCYWQEASEDHAAHVTNVLEVL